MMISGNLFWGCRWSVDFLFCSNWIGKTDRHKSNLHEGSSREKREGKKKKKRKKEKKKKIQIIKFFIFVTLGGSVM